MFLWANLRRKVVHLLPNMIARAEIDAEENLNIADRVGKAHPLGSAAGLRRKALARPLCTAISSPRAHSRTMLNALLRARWKPVASGEWGAGYSGCREEAQLPGTARAIALDPAAQPSPPVSTYRNTRRTYSRPCVNTEFPLVACRRTSWFHSSHSRTVYIPRHCRISGCRAHTRSRRATQPGQRLSPAKSLRSPSRLSSY